MATLTLLTSQAVLACDAQVTSFHIDAQPLDQALIEFGKQSGCSILFEPSTVAKKRSSRLVGAAEPKSALQALLADASLRIGHTANGFFTIVPVALSAPTPTPLQNPSTPPSKPRYNLSSNDYSIENINVFGERTTGSRILSSEFDGFAQLEIITRSDIDYAGHQNIGEVLRFLPAVAGNLTGTLVTNGGDGTATVTLRGLPASNTLVLVNGRRLNNDALRAKAVDLNTIPLGMVERVEVLKDGASAIYGSDAIAGVVNIITRQKMRGGELSISGGESSRSDLPTERADLTMGWETGPAFGVAGISWYRQGAVRSRDRSVSADADGRPRGGVDRRSSATLIPRFELEDEGPLTLIDGRQGLSPEDFRPASQDDRYNFREVTYALVPSERIGAFASAEWLRPSNHRLWAEALFVATESENRLAATPLFTSLEAIPLPIASDHPYNPFAKEIVDLRRRMTEFGERDQNNETATHRWSFGWSGPQFESFVSYQLTSAQESVSNLIDAHRLQQSLGSPDQCVDPCRPINVFGGPGAIERADVDYLKTRIGHRGKSTLLQAGVTAEEELLIAGLPPIAVVGGAEYRFEELDSHPANPSDPLVAVGALNAGATKGDRRVWEIFGEAVIPLWRNSERSLVDLALAGRWSHYSDFGSTATPKATLRWQPNEDWLVRASVGDGFRAPTLQQLFIAEEFSFQQLNDPCSVASNVGVLSGCARLSDPTLVQVLTVAGGSPDLRPEQAMTSTIGIEWSPTPGLKLTVDGYRIDLKNLVEANAQLVLNQNARFGQYQDRVFRTPQGNVSAIVSKPINIGEREVQGVDLSLNYEFPMLSGTMIFAANASHIHRFRDHLDPSLPSIDHVGTFSDEAAAGNGTLPDWKANLGFTWVGREYAWHYNLRRISDVREFVAAANRVRTIDAWTRQDLQLSYTGDQLYGAQLTLGIHNIFDVDPPFAASAFNDSFDARTYDLAGRYWYLALRHRFE